MRLLAATDLSDPLRRRVGQLLESMVECIPARDLRRVTSADQLEFDLILIHHTRWRGRVQSLLETPRLPGRGPDILVFVDREDAVQRARYLGVGALAVLNCGLSDEDLGRALRSIVDRAIQHRAHSELVQRQDVPTTLEDWVSQNDGVRRMLALARRLASGKAPILLQGETGVGKGVLARAIHNHGPRRNAPFVMANCGAIAPNLVESELFGHQAGAFTDASRSRRGLFELAHGGTLFLDEVCEMPTSLQTKLLHALDDGRFRPVGSEHERRVDVRVIAASNRDLPAQQAAGHFRADLYYRLTVMTLTIPPLRDHREDIPLLSENILRSLRGDRGQLPPDILAALMAYDWPGNVRELRNVLERFVLLSTDGTASIEDLGLPLRRTSEHSASPPLGKLLEMKFAEAQELVSRDFAQAYFTALLSEHRGRLNAVSRASGLSPRTLYGTLKRLGLTKSEFYDGTLKALPARKPRSRANAANTPHLLSRSAEEG